MWVLIMFAAMAALVWWPLFGTANVGGSAPLSVHFLDVGQGDATLIETSDGMQVLIDGGFNESVLRELGTILPFFDRHIDLVVATHPDGDHVGGLIDVLRRFEVRTILLTENVSDTPTAAAFLRAVQNEGAEVIYARAGQQFLLNASTTLSVLFPVTNPQALESNAASIVLQLQLGTTEFLFTGDAPASIEQFLTAQYGQSLSSDVLKVGHHGSKTSTDPAFVLAVDPTIAVISAGADNRYGHPHQEVLSTLTDRQVYGTYEEGMVTVMSDGTKVWVK